jgi:hypothetical protein
MEHNHLEHCMRDWAILVEGLALVALANVVFLALLGGAGRLLARRVRPVSVRAQAARVEFQPLVRVERVSVAVHPAGGPLVSGRSRPRTCSRGARSLLRRPAAGVRVSRVHRTCHSPPGYWAGLPVGSQQ